MTKVATLASPGDMFHSLDMVVAGNYVGKCHWGYGTGELDMQIYAQETAQSQMEEESKVFADKDLEVLSPQR